ncbi:hypothetical protein Ddc_08404 [Ditylenchus destructor]|nr:hypothetical protein Ddc_08404 [Ditylenchus destructor]
MNELLAIIIIVVICCAMFFAWLFSMATCPDRMVNLISGTTNQQAVSSSASSSASKELITSKSSSNSDDGSSKGGPTKNGGSARSSVSNFLQRLNSQRTSTNSKKLSVVPEQDEQLTVTSISQLRQQNRSIQKQPQSQHSSILPQDKSNTKSSCRIIMEEEPVQPIVGRTIYLRQGKGHPGVHLLQQAPDNEDEGNLGEERCVEDVIQRRNWRRQYPQLDDDAWGPGSNPDSQPITADVTPVPSRTSTNPGSLALAAAQAEEDAANMVQSTQTSCINPALGQSAPAIIHVI